MEIYLLGLCVTWALAVIWISWVEEARNKTDTIFIVCFGASLALIWPVLFLIGPFYALSRYVTHLRNKKEK